MPKKKKTAKKKTAKKKTAKKKTAKKKTARAPKKTAKTAKKKTAKAKTKTAKKKTATTKKKSAKKKTAKKKTAKKKTRGKVKAGVVPWSKRFKSERTGPWTCPKCGPLSARAQPLYGEDERHHCPNLDCDSIVTLLSKEDLEPAERRGSWPPQRSKNRPPRDD